MTFRAQGPIGLCVVSVLLAWPAGVALAKVATSVVEAGRLCASGQADDGLNVLRDLGLLREGMAATRRDYADTVPVVADCYAAQGLTRNAMLVLAAGIRRAEGAQAAAVATRFHEKLGRTLLQSGAAVEAQREFELALEGLPVADARRPQLALAIAASHATTDQSPTQATTIPLYRTAIQVAQDQEDLPVLVDSQLGLFRVLLAAGKIESGLLTSSRELLQRMPEEGAKAALMAALGSLYARLDEDTGGTTNRGTAIALLNQSAALARASKDPRTEADALGALGRIAERAKDWDKALQYSRVAVARADAANALDSLYEWQWQTARIHEARGQDALAAIAYQQALATLQAIRPAVSRGSSRNFEERVQPVFYGYANLLLRQQAGASDSAGAEPRLQQVTRTIEQLRQAQILNYFADECVLNAERQLDVQGISADAAIIYPIIFEDRLEVLVTSGGVVRRYTANVSSRVLNQTIASFRNELETSRTQSFEAPARQLYDWLIRPAVQDLRARGTRVLVFVPDQLLRTIPPGALYDGERFLIEDFAVAVTPGLTVTNPESIARGTAEVMASGLTEKVDPEFEALPGVGAELDRINALFQTTEFRDKAFTMVPVKRELSEGRYSIVHIATHGQFKANYRESFLLAYDGRITLNDLEQSVGRRRYLNEPVELLVLSACETAQGDSEAALGLAGIALKAGARSALATLWSVNDVASGQLIGEFYTALRDPGVSKAEALRQAQRSLLRNPQLRHPGLWSPYLLFGSWL